MAQRAAGFAKTPPTARGERVGQPARGGSGQHAVALKVAPLLAPYRKHGRLALRIERMPQLARLSAGRNNGNNSWSLTLDDLEGLTYLMPEGMNEPHVLAVRVIGLDEEGSTLALIDLPVSPDGAAQDADQIDPRDEEYLQQLSAELTKVKATLANREAELARQRGAQNNVASVRNAIDAELTSARAAWKLELDQRLATAAREAAAAVKVHEAAWQEEHDKRVLESEERTQARIVEARERWRQEAKTAMVKAETAWRSEEATRFAAAEAQWRQRLAKSDGRAAEPADDGELRRTQEELAIARARATSLEKALNDAHASSEQARSRWRTEADAALANAEAAWKAGEAARLSTAQATLQQKLRRELSEARVTIAERNAALMQAQSEAQRAHSAASDTSERDALQREIAEVRATLAERDAALARARSDAAASATAAGDIAELRSQLAAALVKLADSDAAVAQAKAEARSDTDKADADAARAELADARGQISERDSQVKQLRDQLAQAPAMEKQRIAVALVEAQNNWNAGEAERLAAAQEQWHNEAAVNAMEAKARYEAAEAALAQQRLRAERDQNDEFGDARFRDKLTALQAALTARETELTYARTILEKNGLLAPNSDLQNLARRAAGGKSGRGFEIPHAKLIVEIAFAAFLAVAAFLYLPHLIALLPYEWQENIISAEGQMQSVFGSPPAATSKSAGTTTTIDATGATATLTHGANVRAAPSQKAAVIVTLGGGATVTAAETKGSWTHVTLDGGKQSGWVFSAYLQADSGKAAPAKRTKRAKH